MNKAPAETDRLHAEQFAALAHPARLEILRCLARHHYCKCKDVVDVLPLAQSTVSQHLKVLVEAGLVRAEIARPSSRYSLNIQALNDLGLATQQLVNTCCAPSGHRISAEGSRADG